MKKIKKNNKKEIKAPMSNTSKVVLYALAAVVLLVTIILLLIESGSGKVIVRNESGLKLEYVEAYFVDIEGPVNDDVIFAENLDNGDKYEYSFDNIDLVGRQANYEIRFKFEGHERLFVDAGYFNDEFKGKIELDFIDSEDDKVLLKIKASAGILPSPHILCDEEHTINLEEGYVEE